MKVVIYARYSSHSQTEQSIKGQFQVCYEYIKNNGHTTLGEYIDRVRGKSVTEIITDLNARQTKTSLAKPFNKNSLRRTTTMPARTQKVVPLKGCHQGIYRRSYC